MFAYQKKTRKSENKLEGSISNLKKESKLVTRNPIQRWESDSLKSESTSIKNKFYTAKYNYQDEELGTRDEWDDDIGDALPGYDINKYNDLMRAERMKMIHIHHILPRNRISALYDAMPEQQRSFFLEIFTRVDRQEDFQVRDFAAREVLFSLRSNLVLGPSPRKREDDPEKNMDPNFLPNGEIDDISRIYININDHIGRYLANKDLNTLEIILGLFVEAELLYANMHNRVGQENDLWKTMLNYSAIDSWEAVQNDKFRKRRRVEE